MSEKDRAPKNSPDSGPGAAPVASASREKESGRVAFDARGNPIWEWRTGEATFEKDASTSLVRKLEAPHLSLEATAIVRKQADASAKAAGSSCGGFDPYDSGATPVSSARAVSRPAPARPTVLPAAGTSRGGPGFLRKLQAWAGGRGSSRAR